MSLDGNGGREASAELTTTNVAKRGAAVDEAVCSLTLNQLPYRALGSILSPRMHLAVCNRNCPTRRSA